MLTTTISFTHSVHRALPALRLSYSILLSMKYVPSNFHDQKNIEIILPLPWSWAYHYLAYLSWVI